MAMKEHPFVVTTTLQGDGTTIKYDITKPGRSDAVGKAFKINADGKGELVSDGDEIDGKVLDVDDDNKFTAAYMFGGLRFPIGHNETVAQGDRIVGALGPHSRKGYIKALPALTLPTDLDESIAGSPTVAQINTTNAAVNSLKEQVEVLEGLKGKGNVLEVDSVHALVVFGG